MTTTTFINFVFLKCEIVKISMMANTVEFSDNVKAMSTAQHF